jgi:hypothetical protein
MRILIAAVIPIALAALASCVRESGEKPADAKSMAKAQSRLATTPEQARLWEKAAGSDAAGGLEKLPVVENPVAPRPRITVTDRKAPGVAAAPTAAGTGVRILSVPQLPESGFTGAAKVLRVEGDRLELDLGNRRILSLEARAAGVSLRAATGGFGRLELRLREVPRSEIIAVRLQDEEGVLSVLETGRQPLAVKIPLFELAARQVGDAKDNTMQVEVRVGTESKTLAQGQTAEFPLSRLTVGLVSSSARTGAAAARAEGMPFAMRLLAWPTR